MFYILVDMLVLLTRYCTFASNVSPKKCVSVCCLWTSGGANIFVFWQHFMEDYLNKAQNAVGFTERLNLKVGPVSTLEAGESEA